MQTDFFAFKNKNNFRNTLESREVRFESNLKCSTQNNVYVPKCKLQLEIYQVV